ncbi:uncharacterized protein si:ch211-12e13.1 isoform X2 [Corythoichthys intestinalis]|uniref:uncharacterized protein si:ch211-12e13.1 isoform X2 n=1 Tax=Corythoichthys intestinalis TaxID=161448 RepID=UPI0025A67850|nr:uncharacterized protein si:ch211-12e13.1 isoform X2 [Corythoichthys intestinalis]
MRNFQNYILASLSLFSIYFGYVHFYCSHKLLQTKTFICGRLPRLSYLFMIYLTKAITLKRGFLYKPKSKSKCDIVYAVNSCRLDKMLLRRFCSAAGYGWDYPDSEYRDIPLCFPEVLCSTLLLMTITDHNFRLSPAGLVCVRQSIKTHQPVDELKKGPFTLQAQVLVYRTVDVGVEVDILLSATSRHESLVWESILTLLSGNKHQHAIRCGAKNGNECLKDETALVKQVEVRVPLSAGPPRALSFLDHWFFYLPASLFGFKLRPISSLWMLSVCLAEIEKHNGVGVITSPLNIMARFKESLLAPTKVTLSFWRCQSSTRDLGFQMQQFGGSKFHLMGVISKN